jgi:hypothetical protein
MPHLLLTTCPSINPSGGPALRALLQRPFVLSRILARVYQEVGDRPEYMFYLMTQSAETRINLVAWSPKCHHFCMDKLGSPAQTNQLLRPNIKRLTL